MHGPSITISFKRTDSPDGTTGLTGYGTSHATPRRFDSHAGAGDPSSNYEFTKYKYGFNNGTWAARPKVVLHNELFGEQIYIFTLLLFPARNIRLCVTG